MELGLIPRLGKCLSLSKVGECSRCAPLQGCTRGGRWVVEGEGRGIFALPSCSGVSGIDRTQLLILSLYLCKQNLKAMHFFTLLRKREAALS